MKISLKVVSLAALCSVGAVFALASANASSPENVQINGQNGRFREAEPERQNVNGFILVPPPEEIKHGLKDKVQAAFAEKTAPAPAKTARCKRLSPQPQNLFTFVRLLNYAPHPLNEELMKDEPVEIDGKKYWFNIKYNEDWKVINDDEGYIKAISFEIGVIEDGKTVRVVKTPKAKINHKKLRKGQVLGIAEVLPFKFDIAVEDFSKNKKGISELIFKLKLFG